MDEPKKATLWDADGSEQLYYMLLHATTFLDVTRLHLDDRGTFGGVSLDLIAESLAAIAELYREAIQFLLYNGRKKEEVQEEEDRELARIWHGEKGGDGK